MKVCIVGGGAAGLCAARGLLRRGLAVTLFEQEKLFGKMLTHFLPENKKKYISTFKDVLKSEGFVHHKRRVASLGSLECDAFVVANGACPKAPLVENATCADSVIRWYNGDSRVKYRPGKHVCVLGMGDVALDIVKFLLGNDQRAAGVEKITVLSRRGPFDAQFGNAQMRDVVERGCVRTNCNVAEKFKDFGKRAAALRSTWEASRVLSAAERRLRLFGRLGKCGTRAVDLLFDCVPTRVDVVDGKCVLHYRHCGEPRMLVADSVISSIGYEPRDNSALVASTAKPVFYVGTCAATKGSFAQICAQAESVADEISKLAERDRKPPPGQATQALGGGGDRSAEL